MAAADKHSKQIECSWTIKDLQNILAESSAESETHFIDVSETSLPQVRLPSLTGGTVTLLRTRLVHSLVSGQHVNESQCNLTICH